MTVQDLVNAALTLSGRLGPGRSAGPAESIVALNFANAMLESWGANRLTVFSVRTDTWPLTAGTESYTLGPAGTWAGPRPAAIQSAAIVATVEGSTGRFPMQLIGQDEYAALPSFGDQAIIPRKLYSDGAWPLATLYLFPIPKTATHLMLWTWQAFTKFATLADVATFPPGYERAITYNLAIELAPAFGLKVPEAVAVIAQSSREAIEVINARLMPADELNAETLPSDKAKGMVK